MPGTPASELQPVYSHGGSNSGYYLAVAGTAQSSGRPVYIGNMAQSVVSAGLWPQMSIFCTGGTATVYLEACGGVTTFVSNGASTLPSGEWVDLSGGGFSMTSSDQLSKICPPCFLYFRTRISAISGATVTSYIGNAPWFNICYPPTS